MSGVHVTAFAPLGAPKMKTARPEKYKDLNALEEPLIMELAKKYGKTPAQIIKNHLL